MRLAICLYCLGCMDLLFKIAEMSGVGVPAVAGITEDVCEVVISSPCNDSFIKQVL